MARSKALWGALLVLGFGGAGLGGYFFGPVILKGAFVGHTAGLVIEVTPEQPFTLRVWSAGEEGSPEVHASITPLELVPGDYYVEVVPASRRFRVKKLKVHLSAGQGLALPIVLTEERPEELEGPLSPLPPPADGTSVDQRRRPL